MGLRDGRGINVDLDHCKRQVDSGKLTVELNAFIQNYSRPVVSHDANLRPSGLVVCFSSQGRHSQKGDRNIFLTLRL